MAGYVLFLRGINVGGRNRVPMADLRALVAREGFENVVTLLQSGNCLFTGPAKSPVALEVMFEEAIRRTLKVECNCIVRTAKDWVAIVDANPFPAEAQRDPAHLLVVVLKDAPAAKAVAALRAAITGRERVEAVDRQLYAVYPDGIGKSKLTLPLIEKHLGACGTGRNWNTVLKVAQLLIR